MGSIPDYVEALGPMIGAREIYLDQMKAGHEENPSLVLQLTSARNGVWEARLLTYHKSDRTVRIYIKDVRSQLLPNLSSPIFVNVNQTVDEVARDSPVSPTSSALSAIDPKLLKFEACSSAVIERIVLFTTTPTMAAAISALNAKIRSQPVLNYICSTRTSKPLPITPTTPLSTSDDDQLTKPPPPPIYRFLGPSLQLRHPHRSRNGHPERSRNVCSPPPAQPFPSQIRSDFCLTYHDTDTDTDKR